MPVAAYRGAVPVLFEYAPPWVWAAGCALLACFYAVKWPRRKAEGLRLGLRYVVLRWFHSLVWVLLGISLGLHAQPSELMQGVARALAVAALVAYVVFATALLAARRPG